MKYFLVIASGGEKNRVGRVSCVKIGRKGTKLPSPLAWTVAMISRYCRLLTINNSPAGKKSIKFIRTADDGRKPAAGLSTAKIPASKKHFLRAALFLLFLFDATKCGEPEVNRNQFGSSDTKGQALKWPRGIGDVIKSDVYSHRIQ